MKLITVIAPDVLEDVFNVVESILMVPHVVAKGIPELKDYVDDEWVTEHEEEDLDELLEDLTESIDGLFSLTATINDVCSAEISTAAMSQSHRPAKVLSAEELESSAVLGSLSSFYNRQISNTFPELESRLVDILANQSEMRHVRLLHLKFETVEMRERESENSWEGLSTPRPALPRPPPRFSIVPAADMKGTKIEQDVPNGDGLPRPPVQLDNGIQFNCSICFKHLLGVDTKSKWKYDNPSLISFHHVH